ncbi:MAG: PAS domain-containing protein, partial [Spirochaetia bacterium]|nr:PAS domain-containing protein [Spirochaetia bacterium]
MIELHKSIIDASRDFITLVSRDFIYDFANETYCRVMGIANAAVVGRRLVDIWGSSMFNSTIRPSLESCFAGTDVHVIHRLKLGDECRHVQSSYYPFRQNGKVTHAMVFS